MIILQEAFTHLLAMSRRLFQDQGHGVLIQVKDSPARADAVAFGECLEYAIDRLFIRMKTREDTVRTRTELALTFQTTIEGRAVWPINTNHFEILLDGLTSVRATQRASGFHSLPLLKIGWSYF
jgi:hypothetical protein